MKHNATKAQKANGLKLWNAVKDEVFFTDEFVLDAGLREKVDNCLHQMKLQVWRISLANGLQEEALKAVFIYNAAVNDLLAEVYEPVRDDFIKHQPVARNSSPDTQES